MNAFESEIMDQLKTAMKAKEPIKVNTLRAMKSAIKYKQAEKNQQEVTEQEALQIFNSLIKQRNEAAEQFGANGREEEAAKEKAEIEVIRAFLPQPLTEDELKALITAAIEKTGAASKKQMGLVMKEIKDATLGRADGKVVSEMVRANLPD